MVRFQLELGDGPVDICGLNGFRALAFQSMSELMKVDLCRCVRRLLLAFVVCASVASFASGKHYVMYVGTYTDKGSEGIYAYRYDAGSGKVSPIGLAAKTDNPSFLAVDAGRKFVYSVNESHDFGGQASGAVTAFAINRATSKLEKLNEVASRGADPCFISLDRSGKYVLVANYSGGNVAVFPILSDGRLGEASSVVKDEGALGPNKERQESPHAHWIETSARNRFAYVADLGLDRVLIYKFDSTKGLLSSGGPGAATASTADNFFSATLAPGSGPRHVALSGEGNFVYVLAEMDSTVTVFTNDNDTDKKETFRSIQKISALPAGFSGENTGAEIAIHPGGKFLYTSNRGDDSIAVFAIDHASGKLTFVERVPTGGKEPRFFTLDPSGSRLLVANQNSGNIVEFTIDESTGRLASAGEVAKVPSAVCLVFVEED
jgi:6-phosphogluconolactonase